MTNSVHTQALPCHMSAACVETVGNAKSLPGGLLAGFVEAAKRLLDRESEDGASWDAGYMWGL